MSSSEYCNPDLPNVLHYGLLYGLEETGWQFDKHWYQEFDALVCPPWQIPLEGENPKQGLFPLPPRPSTLTSKVKLCFCFDRCISCLLDNANIPSACFAGMYHGARHSDFLDVLLTAACLCDCQAPWRVSR